MNKEIALLFGNGQDVNYLAKFLLDKNYKVIIATRRSGSATNWRAKELDIENNSNLIYEVCDITEFSKVCYIIEKYKPQEVYQLAAMSFVGTSFSEPFSTTNIDYIGHMNVLEAVRLYSKNSKVYFAGSSEQFGEVLETPQTEKTPFNPQSQYAIAKCASFYLTKLYRKAYGLHACSGILFNHTSKIRNPEFVSRKISMNVARIKYCIDNNLKIEPLVLGNVYSKRDFTHSLDMVRGMWNILQYPIPDDYVMASGVTYTIKEMVEKAFKVIGVSLLWQGENENTYATNLNNQIIVTVSKEFYRPAEVDLLLGDYSKAKKVLNWEPTISIDEIVKEMVEFDIRLYNQEQKYKENK